jgi:glycopeptide antibiotics resistance protein
MPHNSLASPNRWRLAGLCMLYAAIMLYSSTLVGPDGPNFVYRDPAQAFHAFLATRYVPHGSDQRADWIGNLLMLVPFGFVVAAALWPARAILRLPAALSAILICVATILAIKYLQLFFPPRTVTLNYILAQSLGAVIGCAACALWNQHIGQPVIHRDLVGAFVLALRLYTAALCLFILMPLDFALSAADLSAQWDRLPETLLILPGHDRPPAIRAVVIAMAVVAFIPVGMMLTFVRTGVYQVRRGLVSVTGLGLLLTAGLYAVSALVISAFPAAPAILYRTAGIVAGAAAISWLVRQDADVLRRRLGRLVPWLVLPYLAGVLLVNQLLSTHWRTPDDAIAQSYPLGILPLFDYYIVTKAEAAKNIVGHAVLYMPVGALLWLRYGDRVAGPACLLAAVLSAAVELGRYLRPGLEGDINAIVVAGLAAWLAVRLMPGVWSMLRALGRQQPAGAKRVWDTRYRTLAAEAQPAPAGDIEHY